MWSSIFNIDYSVVVGVLCSWVHAHCGGKCCNGQGHWRDCRLADSFVRSLIECFCLISFSGGSVYSVCAEEEEDGESCAATQQSLDNSITMNKMKLLKAKMEDMNLNKKVGGYWITKNLVKFYYLGVCKCGHHNIFFTCIHAIKTGFVSFMKGILQAVFSISLFLFSLIKK